MSAAPVRSIRATRGPLPPVLLLPRTDSAGVASATRTLLINNIPTWVGVACLNDFSRGVYGGMPAREMSSDPDLAAGAIAGYAQAFLKTDHFDVLLDPRMQRLDSILNPVFLVIVPSLNTLPPLRQISIEELINNPLAYLGTGASVADTPDDGARPVWDSFLAMGSLSGLPDNIRDAVFQEFEQVLNRRLSFAEVFTRLHRYPKVPLFDIGRVARDFLLASKGPEVADQRPLSLPERARFFIANKAFLSSEGLKLAGELEAALTAGNEAVERFRGSFPCIVAGPEGPAVSHPGYFLPIDPALGFSDETASNLSTIHITDNCSRFCTHCCPNPSKNVRSMPFHHLVGLFYEIKRTLDRDFITDKNLAFYNASEAFDYYDPVFDADFGDVLFLFMSLFPDQNVHLTTRGWYLGNKIGPRAAEKIARMAQKYPGRLDIRLSLDLFDTMGDETRYFARFLDIVTRLFTPQTGFRIHAACSPENMRRSESLTLLMRNVFTAMTVFPTITIGDISGRGRSAKVPGLRSWDVMACMPGFHIFSDGHVEMLKVNYPPATSPWNIELHKEHEFVPTNIKLWEPQLSYDIKPFVPKVQKKNEGGISLDLASEQEIK